jgi:glycosyltransferase involved in cell wall biosynthesis
MTRVAVAMPVYNDERYLPLALDALAAQTATNFHLTVVDDGSTDRSAEIALSYADRISMTLIRAPHRGLRTTKRAAVESAPENAEYVLILDSDTALPTHAIARMVELLDSDPLVAAVSAQARCVTERRWGRGQAFFEDLVRETNINEREETRWIVGACVMFRRSVLRGIRMRVDINEDSDLSLQLRDHYRLLQPRDLIAQHYGVPTTLRGIWARGYRDGLRVRALIRAHTSGLQLGSVSRLVPLPLGAAFVAGTLTLQPWLVGGAVALAAAYTGAFLIASRNVPADLVTRLEGTGLFVLSNFGFALGFLRESFAKPVETEFVEPDRTAQR